MTQEHGRDSNTLGSRGRAHQLWRYASAYLLAIVATLVAFAVTFGLRRSTPAPLFLFFVLPVALSAWYGGPGPSLLPIGLSVVLVKFAPQNPPGSLWAGNIPPILPFVGFLIFPGLFSFTFEPLSP